MGGRRRTARSSFWFTPCLKIFIVETNFAAPYEKLVLSFSFFFDHKELHVFHTVGDEVDFSHTAVEGITFTFAGEPTPEASVVKETVFACIAAVYLFGARDEPILRSISATTG